MKSLSTAWDTDIEYTILSLSPAMIKDRDYWYSTIDRIETGLHPIHNRKITLVELDQWVERCKQEPEDEDQPRDEPAPQRSIRNPRPRHNN